MKFDIVVAGVGGQGVLSVSTVIAGATARLGWQVKQSEVHGMAQRGGAVVAHLRMAEGPVHSDLIPRGTADLILSLEPMEGLRYLEYLGPSGIIATAIEPVANLDDYPDLNGLLEATRATPSPILVDATELAKQAGNVKTANIVMVGAVAHLLPVDAIALTREIRRVFGDRGENVVETNLAAFRLGKAVGHRGQPAAPRADNQSGTADDRPDGGKRSTLS